MKNKSQKKLKLHLACGTNIVRTGDWTNIDIRDDKNIVKHDLRKPLPYETNSVDMIFHEHFIEHLQKPKGEAFLKECYRVLKPGGAMRVGWPDTARLIRAYALRDKKYFNYISKNVDGGEKGMKFRTWDELVVDFFYSWEHRYGYTRSHLKMLLKDIGFVKLKYKKRMQSDYGFNIDLRNDPATTYIETVKPSV